MYEGKKDKTKDYSLGLHSACMNGNVGLVKFALDHGALIDSVVNGFMPLQLACMSDNHIAVVQYLIDRGADVNAQKYIYICIYN
jgi:ankyrin repeat protein